MQTGAVILHYDASYRILEWLLQLGEVLDAGLDNLLAPLINLVLLVSDVLVLLDDHLHGSLGNFLDLLRREVLIIIHVHFFYLIIIFKFLNL